MFLQKNKQQSLAHCLKPLTELFSEPFVSCFEQEVRIDKQLQSGLRVTVQLNKTQKQGEP